MTTHKIATWSVPNDNGDNAFLSKTHFTLDGEATICGTKLDDKYGERTVVAATAKDIVNGNAQYLQAGEWCKLLPSSTQGWLLCDLREAKCCSKCEAKSEGHLSFMVEALVALSETRKETAQ